MALHRTWQSIRGRWSVSTDGYNIYIRYQNEVVLSMPKYTDLADLHNALGEYLGANPTEPFEE